MQVLVSIICNYDFSREGTIITYGKLMDVAMTYSK